MSNRLRWQTERRTKPELGSNNNSNGNRLERGNSGGMDVSSGAASICDASAASGNTALASIGVDPSIIVSVQRRAHRTFLADELQTAQNNDYADGDDSSTSCDEEQPGAYAITRENAAAAGLEWDPTDHLPESRDSLEPPNMEFDPEPEIDSDAESTSPKAKRKERNTTYAPRKWRERKCQIALAIFVVLATAAVVTAFVIMSSNGKSQDAATVTPPTTDVDEKSPNCDFSTVPAGQQIDFALQCECTKRVGQVIDSVAASYQLIMKDPDLVQWLESDITMESCSTENLALLWVAADYVEADAGGSAYMYETIRNRFVLANLYLAWEGSLWNDSANWMTSAPVCVWFGVGCDDDGHIVSLSLPRNMLRGSLEKKLGLISSLQILDLSMNDFSLGSIPIELFTLPDIVSLNLTGSKIVGTIPELDRSLWSWAWSLSRLERLLLSDNALSGYIPTTLERGTALQTLALNKNAFIGSLPVLAGMSNLVTLMLGDTNLGGSIPDGWGNLNRLETLSLVNMTSALGELPSSFRNLTNLKHLDLANSKFEGTLPEFIGDMSSLEYLSGSGVANPCGDKLWTSCSFITSVSFSGSIPTTVGLLTKLVHFEFLNSGLSGPIPSELANCVRLETIALGNSSITGSLPSELGNLFSLRYLDVGYTSITGSVPAEFDNLLDLEVMDVRGTQIAGSLPSGICDSGSSTVVFVETGKFSDCSCCS